MSETNCSNILEELQAIRREKQPPVAKVNFDTAANGSSRLVDSLIIRLADRQNIAVPLTGSAEPKEGQITGGYVHDVDAGCTHGLQCLISRVCTLRL